MWFPFPAVGTEANFHHVLPLAIRFRIRNATRPGTVCKEIAKLVYSIQKEDGKKYGKSAKIYFL
jgi:hypothetical protein